MSTSTTGWIQQNTHTPKRKRAGLVCVACHARKIKCDLQAQDDAGYKRCSRCIASRQECRLRASRRGNHSRGVGRSDSSPQIVQEPSPLQETHHQTHVHRASEMESVICTPPQSTATNESLSEAQKHPAIPLHSNETYQSISYRSNYLYPQLALNHIEPPPAPQSQPLMGNSTEQTWSVSSPQSNRNKTSDIYLGESGFLAVYSQEHREYTNGEDAGPKGERPSMDLPRPDLMQIFTETYFSSCYAFCPVLDREKLTDDLVRSPLLVNALALAGSHIQPPIIPSTKPAAYYSRAKHMFYDEEETDPITCLQAISLFYWWSPRPSTYMQRDSAWWWSAVGIRQAQQMGFHRELKPGHPGYSEVDRGLRRRIWWTLFARERLTAICQSRPCLIDPEDCNIPQPTLDDFPDPTNPKAEVFIYWVRLCAIIGRVAKYRSRVTDVATLAFPIHLAEDLIDWVQTLPQHLKLPIDSNVTTTFDRDVHQLHLPYLAVIITLHLSPSTQPLPRAYVAAVMAASCVARIFKDYLFRGSIRFLMPVSGWICGIATLALLRASRLGQLTRQAEEDIKILVIALTELRVSYPVADMFLQGFERLRASEVASAAAGANKDDDDFYTNASDPIGSISNGMDWVRYFPYMTAQTSSLAGVLLAEHNDVPFMDEAWLGSTPLHLQELFGSFGGFPDYTTIV